MSDKVAISVDNVSKTFKLPHEQSGSIKNMLVNIGRRKKGYEIQQVLNDISFEIKKGEFFGIVGRNGSGKSTLLKILSGIYMPTEGSITVNGKLTPFIELGVGFSPDLTGRENVFLNGALLGFDRKEMEAMYDEIVEFAELERFMDQKLKNYSSGMQVRLAFSIAIKADTAILLFDEVLAVGDENFQKKCLGIFRDLKAAGKTIILVSHSTVDIERFCNRVLVLDKGKQLGVFDAHKAVTLYKEINYEPTTTIKDKTVKPKKRWGNKEIYIDNIYTTKYPDNRSNEKFEITLTLNSKKNHDKDRPLLIGLAIYGENNTLISGPNSMDQNILFKKNTTDLKVSFMIENNPLNQGRYDLTAAVFDDSQVTTYDYWDEAAKFEITSDKEHYGKIVLHGRWE